MSKTCVTVFLCDGKDCRKAWRRVCDGSPGKWLRRAIEEAGLPYKLHIIKTECMDRCDHAACLCCVHGTNAVLQENIQSPDDADDLLAALRGCAEAEMP
jgi:predicted metal-binding protein